MCSVLVLSQDLSSKELNKQDNLGQAYTGVTVEGAPLNTPATE